MVWFVSGLRCTSVCRMLNSLVWDSYVLRYSMLFFHMVCFCGVMCFVACCDVPTIRVILLRGLNNVAFE